MGGFFFRVLYTPTPIALDTFIIYVKIRSCTIMGVSSGWRYDFYKNLVLGANDYGGGFRNPDCPVV